MRVDTRRRKNATRAIRSAGGHGWLANRFLRIVGQGKRAFDAIHMELGRMLAETIMEIDREEVSGPDYHPFNPEIQKWASQQGSVYIGSQKIQVDHPRLRGPQGEIPLKSYETLGKPDGFSEEYHAHELGGSRVRVSPRSSGRCPLIIRRSQVKEER